MFQNSKMTGPHMEMCMWDHMCYSIFKNHDNYKQNKIKFIEEY